MSCQCTGQEQVQPSGKFWCQCHQCWKYPQWKKLCEQSERYRQAWVEGRGPGQIGHTRKKKRGLGDLVEAGLQKIGITEDRYKAAKAAVGLKKKCNCGKRKAALNELGKKIGIG